MGDTRTWPPGTAEIDDDAKEQHASEEGPFLDGYACLTLKCSATDADRAVVSYGTVGVRVADVKAVGPPRLDYEAVDVSCPGRGAEGR